MGTTTFQFDLRIRSSSPAEILGNAKAVLKAIDGVQDAEFDEQGPRISLKIRATFSGAEDAKRLHRKLMTTIIGFPGVSIDSVHTNLTEVFG